MNAKKLFSILLAMLLALAVTGCSRSSEPAEEQPADTQVEEQTDEQSDGQASEQVGEQASDQTDEQSEELIDEDAEAQDGDQSDESAEDQSDEQIPEASSDDIDEDYDIAANLQLANGVDGEGGNTQVIDTDHFTLTLSHGGSWFYEVDSNTSITIYNVASREADCGGRLFSIVAYDPDDKDYEYLPSYSVIGESHGKVYIAEYPTDVQADVSNEEALADYEAVYEEVNKIRQGAEDSPLVLK